MQKCVYMAVPLLYKIHNCIDSQMLENLSLLYE